MEVSLRQQKARHVLHELPHQQQRFNWDCGISCVLMVLPERQRTLFLENITSICQEEGFNQSTWTIDLCYLLKRFNIKHEMYTTTLGVNEDNKRHNYYKKILDQDRERVNRRFSEAEAAGLVVRRRALSGAELRSHVAARGPAILLLDAARLACRWCRHNRLGAEISRWLGGGYRGHYVVACGVAGQRIVFRDPALSARLCAVSDRELAFARAAPGTDADVILLYADAE